MIKKWVKKDVDLAIKLHCEGLKFDVIGDILGRTKKAIRCKLGRLGINENKDNLYIDKKCENCGKIFKSLINNERKYCSQSCSAILNNKKYGKYSKKTFVTDDGGLDIIKYKIIEKYRSKIGIIANKNDEVEYG